MLSLVFIRETYCFTGYRAQKPFCILISCVEILLEQTVYIRALPPALGTSLRQLSPLPEGGYEGRHALR